MSEPPLGLHPLDMKWCSVGTGSNISNQDTRQCNGTNMVSTLVPMAACVNQGYKPMHT